MPAEPNTRLQRLLAHYEQTGQCKPLTYAQLVARAQRLPNLAEIYMTAEDVLHRTRGPTAPLSFTEDKFNRTAVSNVVQICALFGWASYMYANLRDSKEIASFDLQMLLYLYEAKPRMVSLANLGWTQAHFVIWLYQDVVKRYEIGSYEQSRLWLMRAQKPHREDILGRIRIGIARRYTAAFNQQASGFYKRISQNKAATHTNSLLFAKLLESDAEAGYTRALEPNYLNVRDDFYALARFLHKAHDLPDFDESYPAPERESFLLLPMRRTKKFMEQQAGHKTVKPKKLKTSND